MKRVILLYLSNCGLEPGRAGVDCHSPEGQIRASRDLQIMSTVLDVMGLCLFVGPLPPEMEMISGLMKTRGRGLVSPSSSRLISMNSSCSFLCRVLGARARPSNSS